MPENKYLILGFDLRGYSTNPDQPVTVAKIAHGFLATNYPLAPDLNSYIQKRAPNSPLTGEMIIAACDKYSLGANGIAVMVAICQDEGMFGTLGRAVKSRNPGNIGNWDNGETTVFATWQDGVTAVARWLSLHRSAA